MNTIIVKFPCKPTKYRQTMKRRITRQLDSLSLAIGLATAVNGRELYYDSGVRKRFTLDKWEIVYELDFDETWTDAQMETAMRFIERIAKVSSVCLTSAPTADTITT